MEKNCPYKMSMDWRLSMTTNVTEHYVLTSYSITPLLESMMSYERFNNLDLAVKLSRK